MLDVLGQLLHSSAAFLVLRLHLHLNCENGGARSWTGDVRRVRARVRAVGPAARLHGKRRPA